MKIQKIKIKNINKRKIIFFGIILVITAILIVLFLQKTFKENNSKEIMNKVSSLIVLPKDEEPSFFVIEDPKKLLPAHAFFKDAEAGDVLLVYKQSAKAILYGVSRNIIVNSGPIDFGVRN